MSSPDKIGPYQVLSLLGAGGMGEVYRAHDSSLQRDVAIKVLPAALASNADYLDRFKREAQLLAALHHPNIASIFGLEGAAIVMELVEGHTLRGPLPLADAIPIAHQIAEALEAAHSKGIVHRDLKPGNIKVTPEGLVKVLDFGLAKAVNESPSSSSPNSPTLTLRATEAGLILGTAAYMAPEQAAGKSVDRRADIWSFGVILWEVLTGRQLFGGETVSHTLAEVLKTEIDFEVVPAGPIRDLLRRCLDRNLRTRLQHIDEARIVLETYTEAPPAPAPGKSRQLHWPLTAALLITACTGTGLLTWRTTRPEPQPLMRLNLNLGPDALLESSIRNPTFDLSPDGHRIVYIIRGANGLPQLAVRSLDQERPVILAATDDPVNPVFSQDGKWIAFGSKGRLFKILASGGFPIALCDAPNFRGASWDGNGDIIAALDNRGPLSLIPTAGAGGAPRPITTLAPGEVTHRWPYVIPGTDAVLFISSRAPGFYETASIEIHPLRSGQRKVLVPGGYAPRYVSTGDLLYMSQGMLFAAPFDLSRLELTGPPIPLLRNVDAEPVAGTAPLSISTAGAMLFRSGERNRLVVPAWVDASGKVDRIPIPPQEFGTLRLSPNGRQLVTVSRGFGEIVVHDLDRKVQINLPDRGTTPLWTPDGRFVTYRSTTGIALMRADGVGRPIPVTSNANDLTGDWSPSGGTLYFTRESRLWQVSIDWSNPDQPSARAESKLNDFFGTGGAHISRDGRWAATGGLRQAQPMILVFPKGRSAPSSWPVSSAGGINPVWASHADEIAFCRPDGKLVSAPYNVSNDAFQPGTPREWTTAPGVDLRRFGFDLSRDGKRYLTLVLPEDAPPAQVPQAVLLLNFFDEIRRIKQSRP